MEVNEKIEQYLGETKTFMGVPTGKKGKYYEPNFKSVANSIRTIYNEIDWIGNKATNKNIINDSQKIKKELDKLSRKIDMDNFNN